MVREKFIKQNNDTIESLELIRMKTGGETLIHDEVDNLRVQF